MKKNLKWISLLLVLTMLLGVFSACGSTKESAASAKSTVESASEAVASAPAPESEEQESSDKAETSEVASEHETTQAAEGELVLEPVSLPIVDEPMDVTLWSIIRPTAAAYIQTTDYLYLYGEIRDRTNINFDCTLVSLDTASEKFTLMAASSDFTDVVQDFNYYSTGINGGLEDEAIYDLYDDVLEYAPNYWNTIRQYPEAISTLINREGQMGSLATLYKEAGLEATGLCVRGDWMEEFGIDEIITYDDLHEYLSQAAEKKGVGMSLSSDGQCFELSQGFGVIAGSYSTYDNQVKHCIETDGYFDYLKLLNQWYNEGLIDPDFVSQSGLMALGEMFIQDKSSVGEFHAAAMVGLNSIASDPNAVYVSIPNAKQNPEDEYTIGKTNSILKDAYAWSISTNCDPGKIPALLKLVDYFYSEDGILLFNYGTEGYTFDYDADGKPVLSELVTNNDSYDSSAALAIFVTASVPSVFDQAREYYDLSDLGWEAIERFSSQNIGKNVLPDNITSYLTNEEASSLSVLSGDVETHIESEILSMITGSTAPTQEAYDSFVEACISMGLNQMDEYYQTAYDRYLEQVDSVE